ncbi:MAG: hypothetical protein ACOX5G_06765 [Kiritimatiellia bacterium]
MSEETIVETVEGNGTRNGKRGLLPLLAAALVAAGIIPASERAAAQGGAAVALPVRAPRPAPATPLEMALRLERELARGAGRLMPDPERRLALDGGLIPLDDAGGEFPDDFLAGLVPEEADGIEVWRVVLNVDDSTGGVLFYNASGGLFWSVAADVGVWSADWIARLHSPDGTAADFSGIEARCGELLAKPSRAEWSDLALYHAAWLDTRQFFQPSHVEMAFTFILQEDLEAFRSAGSAAGAQAAAGAPMAAPASPAGLAATGIEAGTNGVALSAAWPTNTVIAGGALDIFFSRTLAPPAWTNLWQVEVNPVAGGVDIVIPRSELPPPPEIPAAAYTTNIAASAYDPDVVYTNIICTNAAWMVDSGFFRLADLADSDGDGITDAGEKWMHGTRFDLADSDGDGMPDGWEVANGLDPLAADALSDPDNDRAPAVYEFHHGTNPNCPDSHLIPTLRVDPAAAATNASSHASIRAAFAASAPYSVIEVADGLYSGRANAGLWFPAHPVLLMSEDWGASRLATIAYEDDLAAFYMNARQDNRTIVRGLNLRLGGATPYQIGFWLGDGPPIAPDKGAAPVFEGVTVELGASDVNVGFFCRHSAPGAVRFENCVIRGKRGAGKSMRGIYAIDDAPAMGAHTVTQFAGNASFSFPFSFAPGTSLWIKAACDMDRDGVIDPATEPVYGALFLTFFPRVSIEIGDFDGDGVNDWLENQYGSSPTNPASCHVTVGGAITNLYSDIFTNHVTWGLSASGWNESNAVRIVKEGGFQFPSVPANSARSIYVKAFCDLDGDGIRDAATEPLYVACVTDFARPTVSICINDFDRDGVPDNEEVAEGTDPADGNNYCFSASGVFTNKLWLETDVRLAFERVEDTVVTTLVDFAPTNGPFALPHVSTTVPVAWRLRCYNDDDGDHACGTNEFCHMCLLVRRHHDVRCNITVDDRTFDTDGDGMSDLWERLYDAVAIGVPDALEDPDGDLLVNLHECWSGTDPGIADVTTNTSALANAAFAIDSRIAGKDPAVALPLFENYLANGADGVFLRNTNCWAADLDLTCCSPWNSCENNEKAGTLISPRHVLFAAHHALPAGCFVYFVDRQNNVITRKLVAKRQHPRYSGPSMHAYDITVGLLDADVPTNQISFARVLPDNYADYIRTGARLPAIRLDQEEKALVGDLWNVTASDPRGTSKFQSPADPSRYSFYERVIGGDSGNPALIVVSGEPVLLTVWTFGEAGSGTSVTAFKADINRLMSDLGGGYRLTEADLTGFTPLP